MIKRTQFNNFNDFILSAYNWVKNNRVKITVLPRTTTMWEDFIIKFPNGDEFFVSPALVPDDLNINSIFITCCKQKIKIEDLINKQLLPFI